MITTKTLRVTLIEAGKFRMNFDFRFLRNPKMTYTSYPSDNVAVECVGPGSEWEIVTNADQCTFEMVMDTEDSIPEVPNYFAFCHGNAAAFWKLDGYPAVPFDISPNATTQQPWPLQPLDSQSIASLSYEDVVRLSDELPEWPQHARDQVAHLPFEAQVLSGAISANARTSVWQAQFPGHDLYAGSLLQVYGVTGHVTYNGGSNYVNAFGADLRTGTYHSANSKFPCDPGNAWAFFASGRTHYFRNTAIGYGAGAFSGYDPTWRLGHYWLVNPSDQGAIETIVNDDHYRDNNGTFGATWAQRSGRDFFRHLLMTRYQKDCASPR